MKKVLFITTLFFVLLSFVGAGYVFYTDGQANAGYAVIPLIFALVCAGGYLVLKKDTGTPALKKWIAAKRGLNIAIGVSVGALIGRVTWVFADYKMNPEIYTTNSAPWYTAIIVALVFWGVVTLIEVAALLFVRYKLSQGPVIGIIERKD